MTWGRSRRARARRRPDSRPRRALLPDIERRMLIGDGKLERERLRLAKADLGLSARSSVSPPSATCTDATRSGKPDGSWRERNQCKADVLILDDETPGPSSASGGASRPPALRGRDRTLRSRGPCRETSQRLQAVSHQRERALGDDDDAERVREMRDRGGSSGRPKRRERLPFLTSSWSSATSARAQELFSGLHRIHEPPPSCPLPRSPAARRAR